MERVTGKHKKEENVKEDTRSKEQSILMNALMGTSLSILAHTVTDMVVC